MLTFGNSTSSVQVQATLSPVASAYGAATQGNTYGRSDSGMFLGHLVVLTAPDAAAAASISALLGTSGAIAHVSGGWTLTGNG